MFVLLEYKSLERIDSEGMFKIYDKWPQIAKDSYNEKLDKVDFKNITNIVFSGMGGSGSIHDVFSAILSKTNIHVSVVKGYHLPKTVDSNTLVVVTSVSGNTIETLTVLNLAKKSNCKIIAFSSGGAIKRFCFENHIDYREIPMYLSPRSSLPSFLFSMLNVLEPIIPVKKSDVIESIKSLEQLKNEISSQNLDAQNPALNLANWITEIPIIYYPWGLQAAAVRFKNSLQENAKKHAMSEDVIEACHNGIVAWEKDSNVKPILIRGNDDYTKTKERWKIIKEYFAQKKIEYREIFTVNGNILTKLINLLKSLSFKLLFLEINSSISLYIFTLHFCK